MSVLSPMLSQVPRPCLRVHLRFPVSATVRRLCFGPVGRTHLRESVFKVDANAGLAKYEMTRPATCAKLIAP